MTTNNIGKKAVAMVTLFATVVWSIGLAFVPLHANAATPQAPALVKASGPAVYFFATDGKRYVFPNEKTFTTWYSDFSDVKIITDEELASLPIGGNVVYRPGTRLVKITTDPKVYAVEPGGVLRHLGTEQVAKGLYGDNWADRVDDVPDAFFTNYTTGNALISLDAPAGSVVTDGTNTYFINSESQKQKLSASAMTENRFRSEFTLNLEANSLVSVENGTDINSKVDALADTAQLEKVVVVPVVSGDVKVTLSSTGNPVAGNSIPSGAFYAPMLCLDVENGTNQELKVEGISVKRSGILADNFVSGVLVTDEEGNLHGSNVTFGESRASSIFGSEPIYVASSQTEQVCINVNISNNVNTGTIGLEMTNAEDLRIVTSAGNVIIPTGAFPFKGAIQSIVNGNGALGEVNVSSRTIAGGDFNNPTEIDQGVKNLDIAKFRFQEVTGNEAVELLNITFRNNGSASDGDVENVRLVDQNNVVIGSVDKMVNNEAKFVLKNLASNGVSAANVGPNGGYLIPEGQLRDLTLRVDTSGRSNSANRTLVFTLQEQNDIRILGVETNVGVTPSEVPGAVAPDIFPIGDNTNVVSFRPGNITFSRSTASTAGKIARGTSNVELATFDLLAFGEDIELQNVGYAIRKNGVDGLDTGNFGLTGTLKIQNHRGSNIFSKTATDADNYGTGCIGGGTLAVVNNQIAGCGTRANGVATTHTLNTFYRIEAGETGKLTFVGDIHQNATSQDSYTVALTDFRLRRVSSNNFLTENVNALGNTLTVDASTINSLDNPGFNPVNIVLGGATQKIGSFNLQVGSGEDHKVNAIAVRPCVGAQGVQINDGTCDATVLNDLQGITNITLMVDGVAIAPPFNVSGNAGFTASTDLLIEKNRTAVLDVYAIVSSSIAANRTVGVGMAITSAVGVDSQTTTTLPEVFSRPLLTLEGGQLAVEAINDGTINIPKLLHASESDVELFRFQTLETANAEGLRLEELYIGGRNLGNFTSFKLFRDNGTLEQIGSISTVNNGEIRFTGLNDLVEKGSVVNYIVKGTTNNAGALDLANNVASLGVTYLEYTGEVSGVQIVESGGIALAADVAADTITVNDTTNFENGDSIRIDWNNDGDFADDFTGVDGVNENTGFFVCEVNGVPGTIKLGTAADCVAADTDILAITNFVAGGRISNFTLTSDTAQVEEVEPVLAVHPKALDTIQSVDSQAATFIIAANGPRPISFHKLRVEISGSYEINTNNGSIFGPKNFQLWRANSADGKKVVQIQTGAATLGYVPSGIATADVNGAVNENATTLAFQNGTAGRDFNIGDRITFRAPLGVCGDAEVASNGSMGYRVTGVTGGATGTITFTPGLRGDVADTSVICPLVNGNTTLDANAAQGNTLVSVTDAATFTVGDIVSFVDLNTPQILRRNGQGYRITAIDAANNDLTITPGLGAALQAGDLVRGDGNALLVTDVVESGATVSFELPEGEQIGANASSVYAVVADTSTMKSAANTGTATLTIRVAGERAVENNINGLHWSYQSTTQGVRPILTASDAYPVNGLTNRY